MSLQHMCQKQHGHHVSVYFLLRSWIVCLTIWITGAQCTVPKTSLLIAGAGTRMALITIVARHYPGYKYLIRSVLMTISHSSFLFFLCLEFIPLALSCHHWRTRDVPNAHTLPLLREVLHPATPRLLCRCHLGLHHHRSPRQRFSRAALTH
jgi:hypothetical protein